MKGSLVVMLRAMPLWLVILLFGLTIALMAFSFGMLPGSMQVTGGQLTVADTPSSITICGRCPSLGDCATTGNQVGALAGNFIYCKIYSEYDYSSFQACGNTMTFKNRNYGTVTGLGSPVLAQERYDAPSGKYLYCLSGTATTDNDLQLIDGCVSFCSPMTEPATEPAPEPFGLPPQGTAPLPPLKQYSDNPLVAFFQWLFDMIRGWFG